MSAWLAHAQRRPNHSNRKRAYGSQLSTCTSSKLPRIFPELFAVFANPTNLLLIYCGGHLIFFAQDGDQKGGVAEPQVVQKQQFITLLSRQYSATRCCVLRASQNAVYITWLTTSSRRLLLPTSSSPSSSCRSRCRADLRYVRVLLLNATSITSSTVCGHMQLPEVARIAFTTSRIRVLQLLACHAISVSVELLV